jgi:hypothetical protein
LGSSLDGLQFSNNNAYSPQDFWWKGEMWVSGTVAGTVFVIVVPGLATDALSNDLECVSTQEMSFEEA